MFIDHMLNQSNAPLIQRMMDFTAKRHDLIAENIANISTPGYVQKDFSVKAFQRQLRDRLDKKQSAPPGTVDFDDIATTMTDPGNSLLFHDGGNRSVEQMMADLSSNALKHNMYAEMLRKQYDSMKSVLSERVA